jgi:[pyruvate, water dikinase]-phosphate phosphotransferase / [pyruvate, water dikinase] kinase
MSRKKGRKGNGVPPIYIVSGGAGSSGEGIVNTVLAQFPENRIPMITVGNVRSTEQIEKIVEQAVESSGTIVHTMVDERLRDMLTGMAHDRNVPEVDLMGPLLKSLSSVLGRQPSGTPGLYRKLHEAYFTRIAAIEYTLEHDDGQNPKGWPGADVVLVGISRSGKTPLSVYLSVLGWKVANYPVVPGIPVPEDLFKLDPERVFGLIVDPDRLMRIRSQRMAQFGISNQTHYSDPSAIEEEINAARKIFRQGRFHVINMTDKTIEACASEIIQWGRTKTSHRSSK